MVLIIIWAFHMFQPYCGLPAFNGNDAERWHSKVIKWILYLDIANMKADINMIYTKCLLTESPLLRKLVANKLSASSGISGRWHNINKHTRWFMGSKMQSAINKTTVLHGIKGMQFTITQPVISKTKVFKQKKIAHCCFYGCLHLHFASFNIETYAYFTH
jgi:hypothetical protein